MIPNDELLERGLLIVTGSSLRAEQADRPLAYDLKAKIEMCLSDLQFSNNVVVLSDIWYLNAEALQQLPMISLGGPGVNAVAAFLHKRLANALVIDNTLAIQMDLDKPDLKASIWGVDNDTTCQALDLFVEKDYLMRFLEAVAAHQR